MRFSRVLWGILFCGGLFSCMQPSSSAGTASNNVSSGDMAQFQKVFMSSYYSSTSGTGSGARALTPFLTVAGASVPSGSRATITTGNSAISSWKFADLIASSSNVISNYPENGQTTSFTVTVKDSSNHVYDVKATTSYPATDSRSSYVEEYYVRDIGLNGAYYSTATPDGLWDSNDPIVQLVSDSWTQNQSARVQMLLTFRDGTTRNEYIVANSNNGGPLFAPFDVSGSLDLSQAFVPASTTDSSIQYSSVVIYETHPVTNPNFWFWSGSDSQTILGIRYYTEQKLASTYVATSVSFEKVVSSYTTTGGSYQSTLQSINGSTSFNTLAESVEREQISWPLVAGNPNLSAGTVTKNMQSRVINITGKVDFYLQQLNSDYVTLSSWASGTKYTPTGAVDNVTATDSSTLLFNRTTVTTGTSGALPLASPSTSVGGTFLSQVYASITDGTGETLATTATPSSNVITTAKGVWNFNGQQVAGSSITANNAYKLGKTGTVEAWVYLSALTDTMGIVHYGSKADFSDEGYSLQGWNANGQMTMIVDGTGGGSNYNQVLSKTLLGIKKWYYLVGVWDYTASKPSISLYINGKLDNTNTSLTAALVSSGSQAAIEAVPNPQVMVGSQLPSSYSAQLGYFGVNGKITGVNISSTAATASDILTRYNTYSGNTSGW